MNRPAPPPYTNGSAVGAIADAYTQNRKMETVKRLATLAIAGWVIVNLFRGK